MILGIPLPLGKPSNHSGITWIWCICICAILSFNTKPSYCSPFPTLTPNPSCKLGIPCLEKGKREDEYHITIHDDVGNLLPGTLAENLIWQKENVISSLTIHPHRIAGGSFRGHTKRWKGYHKHTRPARYLYRALPLYLIPPPSSDSLSCTRGAGSLYQRPPDSRKMIPLTVTMKSQDGWRHSTANAL